MRGRVFLLVAFLMVGGSLFMLRPGSIVSCTSRCPSLHTSSSPLLQKAQKLVSILKGDELISRYRLISILRHFSGQFQSKAMAGENERVRNLVVYVTVPNKEIGRSLAKSIINAKLAACVNQVPGIESTYWWQGKVETDSEELLIIKTRDSLLNALTEHVKSNHPYEVPEVIALPIVGGNPAYLKWLEESTKAE